MGQSFGVVDRGRKQNPMESASRQLENADEVRGKDKSYAKLGKPVLSGCQKETSKLWERGKNSKKER